MGGKYLGSVALTEQGPNFG